MPAHKELLNNPFYVLGLPPDRTRAELEREGQKLLGMLELGLAAAKHYRTPLGDQERTADKVRQALAELRDPERRLYHELWAGLGAPLGAAPGERGAEGAEATAAGKEIGGVASGADGGADGDQAPGPWHDGLVRLGYQARNRSARPGEGRK